MERYRNVSAAAAGGILLTVVSMMGFQLSPAIAIPIIVLCLIALAWGAVGLVRGTQRSRPDYAKWDKQRQFKLWELACLWEDEEPSLHSMSRRARKRFQKLGTDIAALEGLKPIRDNVREVISDNWDRQRGGDPKPNPEWRIERDNALFYADYTGEKPPFLFPKERI